MLLEPVWRPLCRWARALAAVARRVAGAARALWRAHRDRVARDPSYASTTGAILAALLGLMPPRDAAAALLAALLRYLRSLQAGVVTTVPRPGGCSD